MIIMIEIKAQKVLKALKQNNNKFSLVLIKLRTVALNSFTDTVFWISSLSEHHSLIEYG